MRRLFDRAASHKPSRVTIIVAAAGALAVLGMLSYLAAVAPRGVPGYDYYKLTVEFRDTADVRLLSEVLVAGRRAGQVGRLDHDGDKAVVELQLKPGERFLRSDTKARVRLKNPVGAKYIELTPGKHGRTLRDGARIRGGQTSTAVDYGELLEAFDEPTRDNLRGTIKGLGGGFNARGQDANAFLARAPSLFRDVDGLAGGINEREGAARRFVPSAQSLAAAYDPVRGELARGFDPEARALAPFVDRRVQTQQTLEQAPSALSSLRAGLDASTPLLNETAGFARAAQRLTRPAPASLRQATGLLRAGTPALARTGPVLDSLRKGVPPTLLFLSRFDPVIEPTARALRSQLRPFVELGGRGCDVLNWAQNWRSALGFGVPTGTDPLSDLDYGQGIGRLNSFRVLAVPLDDEEALLPEAPKTGTASIGQSPYPAPCVAATERIRP